MVKDYILEDKEYFIKAILEMKNFAKLKNIPLEKTKSVANHPDGITNVAYYLPNKNEIMQLNNVSEENPEGTSKLFYKLPQD